GFRRGSAKSLIWMIHERRELARDRALRVNGSTVRGAGRASTGRTRPTVAGSEALEQLAHALLGQGRGGGVVGRPDVVEERMPNAGIEHRLDTRIGARGGADGLDLRRRHVLVVEAVMQLDRTADPGHLVQMTRNAERV